MKSYTIEDQAALLKSTVRVLGLGGLGGGVTEILARSGVGTLKLVDGDSFEDSNLNRLNRKNGHKGTKTQTINFYYWLNSCLGVLVAKILW